ncbi:LOW QUALITY PROTEIN: NADH-ubiquinone oxidoreductase chain 5-like [Pararge aegeria]|uniref:LOW QUALITY PROTEIN: NADH-ubiquinone oxidoreductase chain 5-like n=1 Tax=Pararge aegeria TaxID=116150 RepID=UPI0019D08DC5|nr:LOW QUALITY PROTEIN: NADH-ubiquinone oxidoreductase chain 5-like [Pararge aegeria]
MFMDLVQRLFSQTLKRRGQRPCLFIKLLIILAVLTIFIASICANYEYDLKTIIALSTLSQVGLIIRILRIGYYEAFFHLLTHAPYYNAIFKALLFICAGKLIHLMNQSSVCLIGGLSLYIPLTSLCLNISNLALCGIPLLAGFYSKDFILEVVRIRNFFFLVFYLYYISTVLTILYTIRLFIYLIVNDYNLFSIYNLFEEDYII